MTPLQKSIAEIEALKAEYGGVMDNAVRAISDTIEILTANLEYERGVIVQAWTDGTYGIGDNAHDYYTKTYEQ